jgi:multicomponent K+:H+ antiporter subunit G
VSWVAGSLIIAGALLAFSGSVGLLRLKSFYERVHPPTMGTTLGTGLILIGSMLHFTALDGRPVLHEILIGLFMTLTTPVTYILLVGAALQRDRSEGRDPLRTDAAAGNPSLSDETPRNR